MDSLTTDPHESRELKKMWRSPAAENSSPRWIRVHGFRSLFSPCMQLFFHLLKRFLFLCVCVFLSPLLVLKGIYLELDTCYFFFPVDIFK